jgi:serine phosphatase RsbU (regulator of sigma subunit)
LFFLIIYLTVKLYSARLKTLNRKLQFQIDLATRQLQKQKAEVEQKNTEILDSIEYAKRIQNTILPPQKLVSQYLENSFILYLPKDIVAGDFYWMHSSKLNENEKDGAILFAACDCTGHGVPGAMVSVVCSNALNKAVKEFGLIEPAKILDKVAKLVIEDLSKNNIVGDEIQDGMDASLCSLNVESGELQWAGANNSLYIIKNEELKIKDETSLDISNNLQSSISNLQLLEYKADKQPIGKFDNPKPFTNHKIQLQKGDTIYLFTDGYSDQFGGPKAKKYSKGKFKELLLSIQHLPMNEQREALYNAHIEWRGTQEQVDDICIIGVKL